MQVLDPKVSLLECLPHSSQPVSALMPDRTVEAAHGDGEGWDDEDDRAARPDQPREGP